MEFSKKHLIIIFIVLAILPLIPLLLRPTMIGIDSYSFLNGICGKDSFPPMQIGANLIFNALPCDFLTLKVFLWVFYAFSLGVIALLGIHFFGKNGFLAALFAFTATYFSVIPFQLEEEIIAQPFLWLALLMYFKGKKIEATLLALAIGFLLWGGAWLYLFLIGAGFIPALIAGIIVFVLNWQAILPTLLPNANVAENTALLGFFALWLLNLGWLGFVKNEKLKPARWPAVIYGIVSGLSGKYAYQGIALLAVGMNGLYEKAGEFWKMILLGAGFGMFFITVFWIPFTIPHENTLEAVQFSIQYAKDNNKVLQNDWDIGYYLEFYGYDTNSKGGGRGYAEQQQAYANMSENDLILTQIDLNRQIIKNFGEYKLYGGIK